MTPERWQKVKEIFQAALDRAPEERSAFLSSACGGDEVLRREVESLIASHEKDGSFIDSPAYEAAADVLSGDQELKAGQTIASYEIISFISRGGMGEVYLAQDKRLSRKVALKLLPASFTNDGDRLRRFEQEARAASALNHPNIVTIHEIGHSDSRHYIATEFIDGETLRARISRTRLEPKEALDIAVQISSALASAHAEGIIHRDIKPENIMLRRDGIVKVLDFGLAKLTGKNETGPEDATRAMVRTSAGVVMGTVTYMSPEQARGLSVDARTDIWSLGVVLYEMLTGDTPFAGETTADVLGKLLHKDPQLLTESVSGIPAELQHIVRKALRKDRDSRYQTVKSLLGDLEALKQDLDFAAKLERTSAPQRKVATTTTVSGAQQIFNRIKQHKLSFVVMLAVLFAATGFGYWFFAHRLSSTGQIESIAVMPFVNESGNADNEYLSDGITESLINSLSQLPKLSVKARSTVFRYKGKDATPQQVGLELSVQAVLNGRVEQRGDQLTLSLELVDTRTGNQIWGEKYNRKQADLISLQNEIARDVSSKLETKLTSADEQKLAKNYPENAEAYQLYLKGRYSFDKRTAEAVKQSIEYFQRAIQEDPNYGLAYAGLANAYNPRDAVLPPRETMTAAKMAAKMALELDGALPEAHEAQARVLLTYDWDWSGAERELKRAIELNPNYAEAHHIYSHYLMNMGRTEESLAESRKALEIDPQDVALTVHLGWNYLYARQYDQAINELQKALVMDPSFFFIAHIFLVRAYEQERMYKEANAVLQKAANLEEGSTQAEVAYLYAVSGNRAEATKKLDHLKELYKRKTVSPYDLAIVYAGLGEKDQALEWLQKAFEERSGGLLLLKVEPVFDNVRSDPRFADLLRRIGLP